MITYQQETLYEAQSDAAELLDMHYAELTLNKDVVKLDPMWEKYRALEDLGMFVVYTVRDFDKLVGYSAFFVNQHLHYKDLCVGVNDVLFLHPDYRQGLIGIRLLKYSEAELKKRGVVKAVWHCKDNGLDIILKRLGYKREEVIMGKIV